MKQLKITLTLKDATILLEKVKDSDFNPHTQKRIQSFIEDTTICKVIEDFLIANDLSPFWIPTIKELSTYKGGYGLVRKISDAGGLTNIRCEYALHLSRRYDYKKISNIERPKPPEEETSNNTPQIITLVKENNPEEKSDVYRVWKKSTPTQSSESKSTWM